MKVSYDEDYKLPYSFTHSFNNGTMMTIEAINSEDVGVRIQGENEEMLCDIVIGKLEATILAGDLIRAITIMPNKRP